MLHAILRWIKYALLTIFYRSRLYMLLWPAHANKALILMFHGFYDPKLTDMFFDDSFLAIDKFERLLRFIRSHCTPISLAELVTSIREKKKLPPRAVVITTDDGLQSNYLLAFPLLQKYSIPATMFVTSNFIETQQLLWPLQLLLAFNSTTQRSITIDIPSERKVTLPMSTINDKKQTYMYCVRLIRNRSEQEKVRYLNSILKLLGYTSPTTFTDIPDPMQGLTSSDIKDLSRSPLITIGNHSKAHPQFSKITSPEAKQDITECSHILTELTGKTCDFFAYPHGAKEDINDEAEAVVKAAGFQAACTTIEGYVEPNCDLFKLKRLGLCDSDRFLDFVWQMHTVSR